MPNNKSSTKGKKCKLFHKWKDTKNNDGYAIKKCKKCNEEKFYAIDMGSGYN